MLQFAVQVRESQLRFCTALREPEHPADEGTVWHTVYSTYTLYLRPSHNAAASACPHSVLLFNSFYFQVGLINLQGY